MCALTFYTIIYTINCLNSIIFKTERNLAYNLAFNCFPLKITNKVSLCPRYYLNFNSQNKFN